MRCNHMVLAEVALYRCAVPWSEAGIGGTVLGSRDLSLGFDDSIDATNLSRG